MTWILSTFIWPTRRENWWLSLPIFVGILLLAVAIAPFTSISRYLESPDNEIVFQYGGGCDRPFDQATLIFTDDDKLRVMLSPIWNPKNTEYRVFRGGVEAGTTDKKQQIGSGWDNIGTSPDCGPTDASFRVDKGRMEAYVSDVTLGGSISDDSPDKTLSSFYKLYAKSGPNKPINLFEFVSHPFSGTSSHPLSGVQEFLEKDSERAIQDASEASLGKSLDDKFEDLADCRSEEAIGSPIYTDSVENITYCPSEKLLDKELFHRLEIAELGLRGPLRNRATRLRRAVGAGEYPVNLTRAFVSSLTFTIDCPECISEINGDFSAKIILFPRIDKKSLYSLPLRIVTIGSSEFSTPEVKSQGIGINQTVYAKKAGGPFTSGTILFFSALFAGIALTLLVEVGIVLLHRISFVSDNELSRSTEGNQKSRTYPEKRARQIRSSKKN